MNKIMVAKKKITKGQAVRKPDVEISNVKTSVTSHDEKILRYERDNRWIEYTFRDGVMESVKSSMVYRKTLAEWQFYYQSIGWMLKKARELGYADPFVHTVDEEVIPF